MVAEYADTGVAETDYNALKSRFRSAPTVDDCVAIVARGMSGKVRLVRKFERAFERGCLLGATVGVVIGAVVALIGTVAILPGLIGGAVAGGLIGAAAGH